MRVRSASKVVLKALGGFAVFLALGNLAIYAFSAWARHSAAASAEREVPGVDNMRTVDDRLWRGAAPSDQGYSELFDRGVTTVVDLRAEEGIEADTHKATALGMDVVRIPIRDGQTPTDDQVARFLSVVRDAPGTVFVHCGAGVGRTGTMVAAYLVSSGEARASAALRRNLAVGPPSLEQVAYVAALRDDHLDRPNVLVTALSRTLDAPRRLLSRL